MRREGSFIVIRVDVLQISLSVKYRKCIPEGYPTCHRHIFIHTESPSISHR
jgi:hypothetical protein